MPEWRLLNARLTVFVAPDTVVPSTLWRDLIGEEPETSTVQRSTATRIESGPFADGILKLQIQPMRIDWAYEPVGMEAQDGLPPFLGHFPSAAEPLIQFGHRWVAGAWFPSVSRVAIGFTLLSPTSNPETGYQELRQFIDGVPSAPDAKDFHYQVNRPRASRAGVDGLQVNRLSKWSVGAFLVLAVAFDGTSKPNSTNSTPRYHLHLDLDINTSADFQGVIARGNVDGLLDDLFMGGREISESGNHF